MRSRCFGSMFAWILNTKPENAGSAGCTTRARAVARLRRRRPFDQRLQDLLHAEVVDRRSRRTPASAGPARNAARSNGCARVADQVHVVPQRADLVGEQRVEPRIAQALDQLRIVGDALLARREALQAVVPQVEHAAEALAHADRPVDRRAVDLQHRLDLVLQRERLAHLAVHLVHERDDRRRRRRQTSSSLIVCSSTPFAASITITAASTAVSTR